MQRPAAITSLVTEGPSVTAAAHGPIIELAPTQLRSCWRIQRRAQRPTIWCLIHPRPARSPAVQAAEPKTGPSRQTKSKRHLKPALEPGAGFSFATERPDGAGIALF